MFASALAGIARRQWNDVGKRCEGLRYTLRIYKTEQCRTRILSPSHSSEGFEETSKSLSKYGLVRDDRINVHCQHPQRKACQRVNENILQAAPVSRSLCNPPRDITLSRLLQLYGGELCPPSIFQSLRQRTAEITFQGLPDNKRRMLDFRNCHNSCDCPIVSYKEGVMKKVGYLSAAGSFGTSTEYKLPSNNPKPEWLFSS